MIRKPMDVLKQYPIRKSAKQKQAFRDAVRSYAADLGYTVNVEIGSMGVRNVVIGNPDTAKYLITAHYDTPARMIVPNLITPCNFVTFVLYQLAVAALVLIAADLVGVAAFAVLQNVKAARNIALIFCLVLLVLMMAGPANKNNANDNTSGVVTVLEIARTMPQIHRDKVCFVLFDLEELGMVGSGAYRKKHKKATNEQIVLNLDCVGDGNHILIQPFKKAKKDSQFMNKLERLSGSFGDKRIEIRDKGFRFYPSDQTNFPKGVGIAAFRKNKWVGYYCARIHTSRDTILEETNVNILRACLTTLISCDAAQYERNEAYETV